MSGIVGIKLNIRGSGLVASYGTDGQHLLSAGAGVSNVFETVAGGGGKLLKTYQLDIDGTAQSTTSGTYIVITGHTLDITLTSATSKVFCEIMTNCYGNTSGSHTSLGIQRKVTSDDSDLVNFGAADVGDHLGGYRGFSPKVYQAEYLGAYAAVMDNFSTEDPGSRDGLELTYTLIGHGDTNANQTSYFGMLLSVTTIFLSEIEAN